MSTKKNAAKLVAKLQDAKSNVVISEDTVISEVSSEDTVISEVSSEDTDVVMSKESIKKMNNDLKADAFRFVNRTFNSVKNRIDFLQTQKDTNEVISLCNFYGIKMTDITVRNLLHSYSSAKVLLDNGIEKVVRIKLVKLTDNNYLTTSSQIVAAANGTINNTITKFMVDLINKDSKLTTHKTKDNEYFLTDKNKQVYVYSFVTDFNSVPFRSIFARVKQSIEMQKVIDRQKAIIAQNEATKEAIYLLSLNIDAQFAYLQAKAANLAAK